MKKASLLLLGCAATLLFSQCSKPTAEQTAPSLKNAGQENMVAATAAAPCACQESSTKVTGTNAAAWAKQFAPLIKFDRSAPDYPTTVEDIWANTDPASITCGGKLVLLNDDAPRSMNFPTYYDVQVHPNDANRIFIEYWWLYKRQGNCVGATGGHDYDLEHMVIQFNKSTQRIITVTYFQHAGWYTKDWRNVAAGTRVQAYVGKKAHGMYHMSRSSSFPGVECTYWGDYRNPDGTKDEVLTGNNVSQMDCSISQFNYSGDWGNPGKGPLFRDRAFWNYASCKVDGCSECDFDSSVLLGSIN
ncbi:hypothetical protein [Chitinophaga tropicalis]|uniref:Uncharacterized protein n=1 Tax=Chitinophaga tropicalis TaxID=2683588 RepID=A0A7K1TXB2_9BACT|nr:hypothetical protein [Chitinophaga tropicalis]MVT06751.1 hypothetical protein [Chitinophaga tropicalis]